MSQYARTLDELSLRAVRYWPHAITEAEANLSILPRLLETQDQFISVLTLAGDSPEVWESLVDVSTDMPANLFLKHLIFSFR